MKQKYIRLVIVLAILLQIFTPSISQVYAQNNNAKKQPAVCAGPSETMKQYFQFQKDALSAIIGSSATNGKLSTRNPDGWLFTNNDLSLPSSALDYVAGTVLGKGNSIVSTTATSAALFMLASSSVIQSDVEGFAIFVKDRPIVRDYREMLDIENEIFQTAFSFSKKINLTRPLQGNTLKNFDNVVKSYQASGLLRPGLNANGSVSMANILSDLVSMNASMKFFISMGGEVGASELRSYAGCLGQYKGEECDGSNFVLGFSNDAVSKLKEEYKGLWVYSSCNSFASNFKNSLSKGARNNKDLMRNIWVDMKVSWRNLINALIGQGTKTKQVTDNCKVTDYERAQLNAYYGGDRSCSEGDDVAKMLADIKEYEKNKKTLASQGGETDDMSKKSSSSEPPSLLNLMDDLKRQKNTEGRNLVWYRAYSGETLYNSEFSNGMNDEFTLVFDDITEQFGHSQRAAMASDLSYELSKFRGLLDQVGSAMKAAEELRKDLQDIVDYQCSR